MDRLFNQQLVVIGADAETGALVETATVGNYSKRA
jgi:hypothetical protein